MGRGFKKMIIKWIIKVVLGILYLGNFINTALIKSCTFGPGEVLLLSIIRFPEVIFLDGAFALHY